MLQIQSVEWLVCAAHATQLYSQIRRGETNVSSSAARDNLKADRRRRFYRIRRERFRSGRTALFEPRTADVAEAFDGAVDRCVGVRPGHSDPDRSGRFQGHRHGAADAIAGAVVRGCTKQNSSAAELENVARQGREYAVLSVRPRLRADGVGVGDDVNAFHSQSEPQVPGQQQRRPSSRLRPESSDSIAGDVSNRKVVFRMKDRPARGLVVHRPRDSLEATSL